MRRNEKSRWLGSDRNHFFHSSATAFPQQPPGSQKPKVLWPRAFFAPLAQFFENAALVSEMSSQGIELLNAFNPQALLVQHMTHLKNTMVKKAWSEIAHCFFQCHCTLNTSRTHSYHCFTFGCGQSATRIHENIRKRPSGSHFGMSWFLDFFLTFPSMSARKQIENYRI